MCEALRGHFRVAEYARGHDLLTDLRRECPTVIIHGTFPDLSLQSLLEVLEPLGSAAPYVLLACSAEAAQSPASHARGVYCQLRAGLTAEELYRLVSAATRAWRGLNRQSKPYELAVAYQFSSVARRVAMESTTEGVARTIEAVAAEVLEADRVSCLFFDPQGCVLWREFSQMEEAFTPPRGLAGWATTALDVVVVERAAKDPRYAADVDDPEGRGDERLLVLPVYDSFDQCHATLVAARAGNQAQFDEHSIELARALASALAPHLQRLSFEIRAQEQRRAELAAELGGVHLFRGEALDEHAKGGFDGPIVRISPAWMNHIFWVLLALAACGVLFVWFARVPEYSEGPAIVLMGPNVEVAAGSSGRLGRVLVTPGQQVRQGDALMHLFTDDELAELDLAELEWAAALRNYLVELNPAQAQLLLGAQSAWNAARSAIEKRVIYAPHAGIASEPRIRLGQAVVAGEVLMAVVPTSALPYVVAALPGKDRARLQSGQRLRLELEGHRQTYLDLAVVSVGEDVLGVNEARRLLGGVADTLAIPAAVTLVTAEVPMSTFENRGRTFAFSHGMTAVASIAVGSQTLLRMIFPGTGEP